MVPELLIPVHSSQPAGVMSRAGLPDFQRRNTMSDRCCVAYPSYPTGIPTRQHEGYVRVSLTTRPGVHLVSPGLLQLTAVRHQRRSTSTPAVGAERCRPPGHRRPSV